MIRCDGHGARTNHDTARFHLGQGREKAIELSSDYWRVGAVTVRTAQMRFAAREIIYREGSPADDVFLVQKGIVKLISYLPNGRARIVRLHAPGSILGLVGLFGGDRVYEHTAAAVWGAEVQCIPHNSVSHLKDDNPATYLCLLESVYDHIKEADMWITQFSTGSVKARVARLIRFLSTIELELPPYEVELMTCEEMGEILGVTPESISRVMAEFKRSGLLATIVKEPLERYRYDPYALQTVANA